jgi:hypothetical protein
LTRLFSKEKKISSSPDRDVVIFGRPLNYLISYYDHSAAKWRIWFDWKERAQDRECLRSKHKGNDFPLGAFMKINRLSSFFSEICRLKFSNQGSNLISVTTSLRSLDARHLETSEEPK